MCPRAHARARARARPHIVTHAVSSQGNPSSPPLSLPCVINSEFPLWLFPSALKGTVPRPPSAVGWGEGGRDIFRGVQIPQRSLRARASSQCHRLIVVNPDRGAIITITVVIVSWLLSLFRLGTIFRPPLPSPLFSLLETARKRIKRKTSRRRCYLLPEEGAGGRNG